jgi:flavocytochrome c
MTTARNVLVIGAGGAGLSAAIAAAAGGARVTVVDAADNVGGATARAGGVVYAAGTRVQQAAGVTDDIDELYAYYMTISHYQLEPRLVRTAVQGSAEVIEWLTDLGVEWDPARLYIAGLETRPRGHMPSGDTAGLGPAGGAVIVAALLRAVAKTGVTIRTGTRATELINDEAGGVTGARTENGDQFHADAVIVATGGFGNSPQMRAKYYPDATIHGDWHWYIGPPENIGDGLAMGLSAGGTVVNENAGVLLETPNFSHVVDAFTPPWLVFVNSRGQRFINEMASYSVLGDVIARQPGSRCYAIFDEGALDSATEDPAFTDPYGLGVDMESNWTADVLRAQTAAGLVHTAPTVESLAKSIGVPPDGLITTIEHWNADVSSGRDGVFDKPPTMLLPIVSPPYYAVELRPAIVGMTFAGLRIDERARVLDTAGRPIAGLYAAGEVTGGLMGQIYPAGGTSIGNALVFGRIAGAEAARNRTPYPG